MINNSEIIRLSEDLDSINNFNKIDEELRLIEERICSEELTELIKSVNETIKLEKKRLERKNKSLDIINSLIRSGMWTMEFNEAGEMTNVTWSSKFRNMLGFESIEEFPDKLESWSNRLHPEHKENVLKQYWDAVKGKGHYDVEYLLQQKDGSYRWYRATGDIDRRPDGSPIIFVGTFIDINMQKENERLREDTQKANEANMAKTKFLSHMSHDIRTPINGILGLISIGDLYPDDMKRQADCRNKIKIATQHLLALINNVLDLTKLESESVSYEVEEFNLRKLVDSCITMLIPQAQSSNINMSFQFGDVVEKNVISCSLYIRQILINLLSNAIKYNKVNGSVLLSIDEISEKESSSDQVYVEFVVKDSGIGMSKVFLERIFEPFSQEKEHVQSKFFGSGLGMAITKQLIDLLDGEIFVESVQNEGSCFRVVIPFKVAVDDGKKKREKKVTSEDFKGIKILLAEDNELNREIAQCLLENSGITVYSVVNGKEAVSFVENMDKFEIDAILMDVMMPVMNGYEATAKIRDLDREDVKDIPIFAMTANAFADDVKRARDAGMNEHIAKPVEIQKVLDIIASYCL